MEQSQCPNGHAPGTFGANELAGLRRTSISGSGEESIARREGEGRKEAPTSWGKEFGILRNNYQ